MTPSAYLTSLPPNTPVRERQWQEDFYSSMPQELQALVDQAAQITTARQDTIEQSVGLIDHTSLNNGDVPMVGIEEPEDIERVCKEAAGSKGKHTAAVCFYPNQIEIAKKALNGSHVQLAVVNNFPHGSLSAEEAARDAAYSIAKGGRALNIEIDTVVDYVAWNEGRHGDVRQKLEAVSSICQSMESKLKIILKASTHKTHASLRDVARLACSIEQDGDFVKTCTGKKPKAGYGTGEPDASNLLHMVTVMKAVADYNREHGMQIGVKISGGVKYPMDCERLRFLFENTMGAENYHPDMLRIGASSLLKNLSTDPAALIKYGLKTQDVPSPGNY